MSEIAITKNYSDMSDSNGFQFEFHCERCGDAWRTPYHKYAAGTATSFLDTASSLLGGLLGGAERVAERVRDSGYKSAHDNTFEDAIEQAKVHFHRCRKCSNYFCAQCYNPNLNLCIGCAPTVEEEANVAAREAEIEMARARAQGTVQQGKRHTDENVVCSACQARVRASKFCSECGEPIKLSRNCINCEAELDAGVKFCPECGSKQ